MMRSILLVIFIFSFSLFKSQDDNKFKDSLIAVCKMHPNDTSGCRALWELSLYYENADDSLSLHYARKCLKLATSLKSNEFLAEASNALAISYYNVGKIDSSIYFYKKAIVIDKKMRHDRNVVVTSMNLGIAYRQTGKLFEAITSFYDALKYAESDKDTALILKVKMLLGNAYRQKKDLGLAKSNYFDALRLSQSINDPSQMGFLYNNIGLLYSDFKNHDTALYYFFKSLNIRDSLKQKKSYATTLENIACEYAGMQQINKAISYHSQSLAIYEELKDQKGLATTLINIAAIDTRRKKYKNAIDGLKKALEIANTISHKDMIKEIYLALSQNYEANNQFLPALEFHKKFLNMKDSILGEQESEKLIEMNTKYETEKKETQNKLLETKNQLATSTIKQQQITVYFILAGLLLTTLLAIFIFKGLRQQRKANSIINSQKIEVENQKQLVDEKQKEILDSIHYAKRIQNTLLAHSDFVNENIANNFILFKPKDIVSGDFYWATKKDNLFYLAVCDSTGHGVPGAFMSLLNIGFLSEAINEKNIYEPHKVLNYVRTRLEDSISKEGQKDGFDGILMCLNVGTKQITYAAANNAPIIIRGSEIIELPKDRMPVGKGDRTESFTLQQVNFQQGDSLYLYTDGYADQFGGPKGKKFLYKKLNQLILETSTLPFQQQKEKLNQTFEQWKGSLEQVDDVLIIGINV